MVQWLKKMVEFNLAEARNTSYYVTQDVTI